jgi:hypothetical protein
LFVAAGLLVAVWALVKMRSYEVRPIPPRSAPAGPVKILQFYASTGTLVRGEKALLCYGVENAKSVQLSPEVEPIWPSPNRCFEIVPQHTTHYTLMAEGFDGQVATQSLTLPVNAAPPPPPQILHFAGTKMGGRAVRLCYEVRHAERVAVEPAVVAPSAEARRCFDVEPARTTTYTLNVFGSGARKASKQVIVEVEGS